MISKRIVSILISIAFMSGFALNSSLAMNIKNPITNAIVMIVAGVVVILIAIFAGSQPHQKTEEFSSELTKTIQRMNSKNKD